MTVLMEWLNSCLNTLQDITHLITPIIVQIYEQFIDDLWICQMVYPALINYGANIGYVFFFLVGNGNASRGLSGAIPVWSAGRRLHHSGCIPRAHLSTQNGCVCSHPQPQWLLLNCLCERLLSAFVILISRKNLLKLLLIISMKSIDFLLVKLIICWFDYMILVIAMLKGELFSTFSSLRDIWRFCTTINRY